MELIEVEKMLRQMAIGLDAFLEEKIGYRVGFALLVFEFNAPGISHYISNSNREDMVKSLEEALKRLKEHKDIPATHPTIQ